MSGAARGDGGEAPPAAAREGAGSQGSAAATASPVRRGPAPAGAPGRVLEGWPAQNGGGTGQAGVEDDGGFEWAPLGGISPASTKLFREIQAAARSDRPVLIVGPAGSEKVAVARAIHHGGQWRTKSFRVVHCTAASSLALLGEKRGVSQTQAVEGTVLVTGIEVLAKGGGDRIEELLRQIALCDHRATPFPADRLRLLMTTSDELHLPAWEGHGCRGGLPSQVMVVEIPGLGARRCDIPILAGQLLVAAGRGNDSAPRYLAPEALAYLLARPWPGNVCELAAVLAKAASRAEGSEVTLEDLLAGCGEDLAGRARDRAGGEVGLAEAIERCDEGMEAHLIAGVLARTGNNRTRAAELLGIGRRTLLYKLKKRCLSRVSSPGRAAASRIRAGQGEGGARHA